MQQLKPGSRQVCSNDFLSEHWDLSQTKLYSRSAAAQTWSSVICSDDSLSNNWIRIFFVLMAYAGIKLWQKHAWSRVSSSRVDSTPAAGGFASRCGVHGGAVAQEYISLRCNLLDSPSTLTDQLRAFGMCQGSGQSASHRQRTQLQPAWSCRKQAR